MLINLQDDIFKRENQCVLIILYSKETKRVTKMILGVIHSILLFIKLVIGSFYGTHMGTVTLNG